MKVDLTFYHSDGKVESMEKVSSNVAPASAPELQKKDTVTAARDIAVIGMSCRLPGAKNYHEFWQNLLNGSNSISEIPADRWDWKKYYGNPQTEENKTNSKWGGFIEDIDCFDPLFFGISPKEANYIDPQHRIFLEEVWSAIEDAGYKASALSGKKIGVYAGVSKNDYAELMEGIDANPFISTGTVHSILPNRVSYLLNLRGKSEAVDTACSSALVALNNAIRDLLDGETEAAIVGGVNALLSPRMYLSHGKSGMLSSEGQCKTFDESADGYVRSEGVAVVFLKTLEKAQADGDTIIGVIKSTAVNHGGRGNFLTAPNVAAQSEVVCDALDKAGIDPGSIGYIETHGTGTPLGDPIEINALKKAYRETFAKRGQSPQTAYCGLGAVKGNIGHLESAAGMASIIKCLLALKYRKLIPVLHLKKINPSIEIDNSPFYMPASVSDWKATEGENGPLPRRAALSGFGMGGVNAHVIIEEAPQVEQQPEKERPHLILLSAKKGRLGEYVKKFRVFLQSKESENLSLRDLSFTLANGREYYEERLGVTARNVSELRSAFEHYASGTPSALLHLATVDEKKAKKTASPIVCSTPGEVLKAWLSGEAFTFSENCFAGKKVQLPTYPFLRRKCWFDPSKTAMVSVVTEQAQAIQPQQAMEHRQLLSATAVTVQDHRVQSVKTLPGVGYLTLLQEILANPADGQALQWHFKDVFWLTPITFFESSHELTVSIRESGEFTMSTSSGIHCQGVVTKEPATAPGTPVVIQEISGRCPNEVSEIYALFAANGLHYGPSFRGIETIHWNDTEAIAKVVPYAASRNWWQEPGILDLAFQTAAALSTVNNSTNNIQCVPYFVKDVVITTSSAPPAYIHVTQHPEAGKSTLRFGISLMDTNGCEIGRFTQFTKRVLHTIIPAQVKQMPVFYYQPDWVGAPLQQAQDPEGTIMLLNIAEGQVSPYLRNPASYLSTENYTASTEPGQMKEDFLEFFNRQKAENTAPSCIVYRSPFRGADKETDLIVLFQLVQAIMESRQRQAISILYVNDVATEAERPFIAAVAGFARTLLFEAPKLTLEVIATDAPIAEYVQQLQQEWRMETSPLHEIRYEKGERMVRVIHPVEQSEIQDLQAFQLKSNGVYILAGGSGGLGKLFALQLARSASVKLVLLGRRDEDDEIRTLLGQVKNAGSEGMYAALDITNATEVTAILQDVRTRWGTINGVIQAGGIIEDSFILRKTTDSFQRVLAPKIRGTINLDNTTATDALDFFLCFSSIAALMPNQGQCDYASGNSFMDSFAGYRNQQVEAGNRKGLSLAINWPLWLNGGMKVTREEETHLWEHFGMKPLETAKGTAIFFTALELARTTGISGIIAIEGVEEKIRECLRVQPRNTAVAAEIKTVTTPLMSEEQLAGALVNDLKSIVAQAFSIPVDTISTIAPLRELGIDSVVLLTVTGAINDYLGVGIKPPIFFEYETLEQLTGYLLTEKKALVEQSYEKFRALAPLNRSTGLIDMEDSRARSGLFRRTYDNREFYMVDHVVEGKYNVPGACFIEMARQAAAFAYPDKVAVKLSNNFWAKQLSSDGPAFTASIQLKDAGDRSTYEIFSVDENETKVVHATGEIRYDDKTALFYRDDERLDLEAIRKRCGKKSSREQVYAQIHAEGLIVGPSFMPMEEMYSSETEALSSLSLPEAIAETWNDYLLHPTTLTGIFQTALINNRFFGDDALEFIPMAIESLELKKLIPRKCYVHSTLNTAQSKSDFKKFDMTVCDEDGTVLLKISNLILKAKPASIQATNAQKKQENKISAVPEQETAAMNEIRALLSPTFGLAPSEIDDTTEFDQYGINSVMILELNKVFEEAFGVGLSKTLFFEYQSLAELTAYLLEEHSEAMNKLLSVNNLHLPEANTVKILNADPVNIVQNIPPQPITAPNNTATITLLKELLSPAFGLTAAEMDDDTAFDEYGINSVMILELNKVFEGAFGVGLSKTLFFEYQTILELAAYFTEEHSHLLNVSSPGTLPVGQQAETPRETVVADRKTNIEPVQTTAKQETTQESTQQGAFQQDDIAIIGIAGKYPEANDLAAFWSNLKNGKDSITDIPEGLFEHASYTGDISRKEGIYCKQGGFIDDVDAFDAAFFSISAEEARLIDPQERLFLQVAYQAFEDAGYPKSLLSDPAIGKTGVYVGAIWQHFSHMAAALNARENTAIAPTSLLYSIANRVSYSLNLRGVSMAVDTACSSSLTALHLACQSLLTGENQLAIAGGVNLSLSTSKYLWLCTNDFLSTDGKCRSFGEGGDGYVPGEGIGAVILKPLSKAISDNDHIYGVIRGISVNHGGKTNGYTVPNPRAQKELITGVLEKAGIDPRSISYVEAHGTGTSLGDTIEVTGLSQAFRKWTGATQFCAIGSVKTNIGHLEAASGIAELTKVLLQMQHKQLVPSLHSEIPNSNINFAATPFRLQQELSHWEPVTGFPRRAAISSFGAGGTNAHVVVDEYVPVSVNGSVNDQSCYLVTLSAKTEIALLQRITDLSLWLETAMTADLPAISYTLTARRDHFRYRCAFTVASLTELADLLNRVKGTLRLSAPGYCYGETGVPSEDAAIYNEAYRSLVQQLNGTNAPEQERRNQLQTLAKLYTKGLDPDWEQLYSRGSGRKIPLPVYPFSKDRYWLTDDPETNPVKTEKQPVNSHSQQESATTVEAHALLFVRQLVADQLNTAAGEPDPQAGFFELGLTSHDLLQITQQVKTHLDADFLPGLLFEYTTIAALADYFAATFPERLQKSVLPEHLPQVASEQPLPETNRTVQTAATIPVNPEAQLEPFPLNDIQESFLSGRSLTTGNKVGCHIYLELDINNLDLYRLNDAWKRLVAHHPMLRMKILPDGLQQIMEELPSYEFKVADLRRREALQQEEYLLHTRDRLSHKVYKAGQWPLFELCVSICSDKKVLHLSIDELIVDAYSLQLLLQQWKMLYNDPAWQIPVTNLSFRDCVLAGKESERSVLYTKDLDYWLTRLNNLPAGPSLALRSPVSDTDHYRRTRLEGGLDSTTWEPLHDRLKKAGISPTVFLLAVFNEVLKAASGDTSFSLILTFFNRLSDSRMRNIIGPFISTTIFTSGKHNTDSFEVLAKQVQQDLFEDLGHTAVSGIKVLRELKKKRLAPASLSLPVVFTSLLGDKEWGASESFFDRISFFITQTPQVYLDHQTYEHKGCLKFSWDVAEGYFSPGVIEQLFTAYQQLLLSLAAPSADWEQGWNGAFLQQQHDDSPHLKHFPGKQLNAFPLTDQQQAYAFGRSAHGTGISAQLYVDFDVDHLDVTRLEHAWQKVMSVHSMLATILLPDGTQQVLNELPYYAIRVSDLQGQTQDVIQTELRHREAAMISRLCPLGEWPHFDLQVSRINETSSRIHLSIELIIADVASIEIIQQTLFHFYTHPEALPEKHPFSFADCVLSLRDYEKTEGYQQSFHYWKKKFVALPSGPNLAILPEVTTAWTTERLESVLTNWAALKQKAQSLSIAPGIILLGAYAEILEAWSEETPFTIVIPGWERWSSDASITPIVGDFTAMSWLTITNSNESFARKLQRYHQTVEEDLSHRAVSGLRALRIAAMKSPDKNRYKFPVVFTSLSNASPLAFPEGFSKGKSRSQTPQVQLDNISEERQEHLHIHWDKATGVFPDGMIEAMFESYRKLLETLATDTESWMQTDFSRIIHPIQEQFREAAGLQQNTPLLNEAII